MTALALAVVIPVDLCRVNDPIIYRDEAVRRVGFFTR
jgi:hypothetical protein